MCYVDADEDGEAGFTLVELLVSLGLLGLMATYALTTIQRFSDLRKLEAVASEIERAQRTERHLRQELSGMRIASNSAAGEKGSYVQAQKGQLRVANILDDRLVPGKLMFLTYNTQDETLTLTYGGISDPETVDTNKVQLLNGIKSLKFAFAKSGETTAPHSWPESWDMREAPSTVAVFFEAEDSAKPLPPIYISIETSSGYN